MFMERSDPTTATVTVVEKKVQVLEKFTDTNDRRSSTLDNNVVQIDKRLQELKHDMGSRIKTDKDFQASVNEKIQTPRRPCQRRWRSRSKPLQRSSRSQLDRSRT